MRLQNETSPSEEQERRELARVLASDSFVRAPGLAKLLSYLCEKRFNGESGELKEYTIAVEFLGLTPAFADEKNSQVRVEIHRLRRKLKEYYESEGADDPIRIVVLPGRYTPVFEICEEGPQATKLQTAPLDMAVQPSDARRAKFESAKERISRWRIAILIGVALCGFLVLGALRFSPLRHTAVSPATKATVSTGGTASIPAGDSVHILAGSETDYVDRLGNTWLADRFFTGGNSCAAPPGMRPFIRRAPDPGLFQGCRHGDFSYAIPLKPGVYELRLYFVESFFGESTQGGGGEGSRTFHVDLNATRILSDFDIIGDAGQEFMADVRVFKDVAPGPDGNLRLDFRSSRAGAIISGIEIVPSVPHKLLPIRIVTQDHSYTDPANNVWSRDRYYSGGRIAINGRNVADTSAPGLFTSERWGNFSYVIPVDRGTYTARLYFAETYYGPDNPGRGDPVIRTFDVHCNGVALLRDFDILKEAGSNHAIVKVFRGLKPTSTGKLVFTFTPALHWALVNAIEILDES